MLDILKYDGHNTDLLKLAKKELTIRLKKVTSSDHRFLYDLLREREPVANISHKKLPSYTEHVKFVKSKPYSKWYVIYSDKKKTGSIYLSKQNEIGIFLKKNTQKKGIGSRSLKLLMKKHPRSRYLANVSPKNKKSQKFFTNKGFNLIQFTYELIDQEN